MTTVDASGERRRLPRPGGLDVALSILVAFNFAVAQPILDLTGRFPQFFLARRSPKIDLILLAFGLAVIIPATVALVVWIAGRIHRLFGAVLHVLAVGTLTASLAIQIFDRIPGLRSAAVPVLTAAALLLGAGVVAVYYRFGGIRRIVRLTAVSALLVPGLFLLSSPASRLVLRQQAAISGTALIGRPTPVVMLVLDELPVASLMGADRGIDAMMFPGFGRLAAGSTWYRNATAVHDFTEIAVPAILTGNYGNKRKLPIASHYPSNVFTLLGGAYDVRSYESFTQLCPLEVCRAVAKPLPSFRSRWSAMAEDLRVVYEHVVAPARLEDDLPAIDQTWSNFGGEAAEATSEQEGTHSTTGLAEDPLGDFSRFVDSIEPTARPAFWFAHVELPHAPWRYLPTGQEYPQRSPIPGRDGKVWGDDEWLLAQAYQRHLMQLAAVDRQVGEMVDRLKETGIYDRALVIVTADHGITFRTGEHMRMITPDTVGDIAAVPMFVKFPGQRTGAIDDHRVQTFDVVPTIADVLEIEGMYPTDGVSMLAQGTARTETVMRSMRGHRVSFGVDGREKFGVLERKLALFGRAGGLERLYALTPGPYQGLLGRTVSGATVAPGRATIDSSGSYKRFDPSADVVRSLVTGHLSGIPETGHVVAVAVGGRVVAVTQTYMRSGEIRFQAMMPPEALRRGENELAVYLVEGPARSPVLRLIQEPG